MTHLSVYKFSLQSCGHLIPCSAHKPLGPIKNVAADREELKVIVEKISKERKTVIRELEDNMVKLEHTVESWNANCENCEINVSQIYF